VTLLAIADREGFVYGSRNGLERAANIMYDPKNVDCDPWEQLMAPDPDSSDLLRNPENEGRRIEAVPGGFRILNYLYYRSLRNEDDRREQNRIAQARHREKVSKSKPSSASVNRVQPLSGQAEAEREAEGEAVPTYKREPFRKSFPSLKAKNAYINKLNQIKRDKIRQLDKATTKLAETQLTKEIEKLNWKLESL